MSWQEDLKNKIFTIITGDGNVWQPKWLNAKKSTEYNASLFEFVNVAGTLVLRQEPKGLKYDLEFYFDGEGAVTLGNAFEQSARNKNNWLLQHPFYGDIICQPLSLEQDNSRYNVSKFIVPVLETIATVNPSAVPVIKDNVTTINAELNKIQASIYNNSGEQNNIALKDNVTMFDAVYSKIIGEATDILEFKKLVSAAIIEIESESSTPLSIIRATTALINYPATISQTVGNRITAFEESLNTLFDSLDGSRESKFRYETLGGAVIGAISVAANNNLETDYDTKNKVFDIQEQIIEIYNLFLTRLDSLQTDRSDDIDSYYINFDNANGLNTIVQLTLDNLYNIAFDSKQERVFITNEDTNLILLTHRFYGLDSEDDNITKFIETNNIQLNEILLIPKGRRIIYFV